MQRLRCDSGVQNVCGQPAQLPDAVRVLCRRKRELCPGQRQIFTILSPSPGQPRSQPPSPRREASTPLGRGKKGTAAPGEQRWDPGWGWSAPGEPPASASSALPGPHRGRERGHPGPTLPHPAPPRPFSRRGTHSRVWEVLPGPVQAARLGPARHRPHPCPGFAKELP